MIRTIQICSAAMMASIVLVASPAARGDQHWQTAQSGLSGSSPAVTIDEAKTITVAASAPEYSGGGVLVTTRTPDGTWEPPVRLGGAPWTWGVHVASNAHGDVVVGWSEGPRQHIAVRPAGQAFLPTVDLPDSADDGDASRDTPQVGIDDAGEVVTAWKALTDPDHTSGSPPSTVHYTAGPMRAPLQVVHSSTDADLQPHFELRTVHQGPSALVWVGISADQSQSLVHAVVRRAGADFGPAQRVTTAGTSAREPAIAVNALGQAAVAYASTEAGYPLDHIELARTGPDGVFEPGTYVTAPDRDAEFPALGWVAGSDIHLAWVGGLSQAVSALAPASGPLGVLEEHVDGSVSYVDQPIQALVAADQSTMTVYGTSDELRSVNGNMHDPEASRVSHVIGRRSNGWQAPALAGDDAGDGVTAWDDAGHVVVSIWDATGPDLKVTAPDTVVAGRPFTVSVGATDTLSALAGDTWAIADAQGAPAADLSPDAGGTATVSLPRPGTYTITGKATDAADNLATFSKTITAVAAPKPPVVVTVACKVPTLTNHTTSGARKMLVAAHCRLGRVTTPKKYKKHRRLVIRSQSRRARSRTTAGARVDVTLGVKPKPKKTESKHKSNKVKR